MIEVEIHGPLSRETFEALREFLQTHGEARGVESREMYILCGYPGWDDAFTERRVDIRLRNTDGVCEIMMKRRVSEHAKQEIPLRLMDTNLENAKLVLAALGCATARKATRRKTLFVYHEVEWSLVEAGKDIYYYEAELLTSNPAEVEALTRRLEVEARALHLTVFSKEELQSFVNMLDQTVNTTVSLDAEETDNASSLRYENDLK